MNLKEDLVGVSLILMVLFVTFCVFYVSAENSNSITITSSKVEKNTLIVEGKTTIDPAISNYIQYYIGKEYPGTTTSCIYCDGLYTDDQGNFKLELPIAYLKGNGTYKIIFEQNPNSNKILPPEHFIAFWKDEEGTVHFGDISSMGELSNLALTVGMKIAETEVTIPTATIGTQSSGFEVLFALVAVLSLSYVLKKE
jgi:hypothetical protein